MKMMNCANVAREYYITCLDDYITLMVLFLFGSVGAMQSLDVTHRHEADMMRRIMLIALLIRF